MKYPKGVYMCTGCKWVYVKFGPDKWQGAIWPHNDKDMQLGTIMTMEVFEEYYADCIPRLRRVVGSTDFPSDA